jgi:hypothetical protein
MTNTEGSESRDDSFAFWGTDILIGICFRVTPKWEQDNWVVTSVDFRYQVIDGIHVELYDRQALRAFAVEQLEDYGVTLADVNRMLS